MSISPSASKMRSGLLDKHEAPLLSSVGDSPHCHGPHHGLTACISAPVDPETGSVPASEISHLRQAGSRVLSEIRDIIKSIGRGHNGTWNINAMQTDGNLVLTVSYTEDEASGIAYKAGDDRSLRDMSRGVTSCDLEYTVSPKRQHKLASSRDRLARKVRQPNGQSNGTVVYRSPSSMERSSLQDLDMTRLTFTSEGDYPPSPCPSPLLTEACNRESPLRKASINSPSTVTIKDIPGKRRRRHRPWSKSNTEFYPLGTIAEHGSLQSMPTILTVERAAAAKIFLETHFHEKLNGPKPREMRRRRLENQLFYSPQMDNDQKDLVRETFYTNKTWHLRETRALKAKSQHSSRSSSSDGPCADNYESLKVLGKGSFGVVRLMKEKTSSLGPTQSAQVFAMKVIRKSDMLRSSQEGHLRAERDFLVLSEEAQW